MTSKHCGFCVCGPSRRKHTFPPLCAVCAGLVRIPLGRGPWLLRLRRSFRCLVRRLHSYYGLARLPTPVHHRLRLFTFPMRTANATPRPDVGSPSFQRDLSARDVLFDPGGVSDPSHARCRSYSLRSNRTVSAPAIRAFRGSITHPTQQLCTLRGRRCRRLTQHSPPGD